MFSEEFSPRIVRLTLIAVIALQLIPEDTNEYTSIEAPCILAMWK
jgi:hypothetical protein